MEAMRSIALSQDLWRGRARSVPKTPTSSVRASASLSPGNVTEIQIVATGQMKRLVLFSVHYDISFMRLLYLNNFMD